MGLGMARRRRATIVRGPSYNGRPAMGGSHVLVAAGEGNQSSVARAAARVVAELCSDQRRLEDGVVGGGGGADKSSFPQHTLPLPYHTSPYLTSEH
jgi:hypothetical protein